MPNVLVAVKTLELRRRGRHRKENFKNVLCSGSVIDKFHEEFIKLILLLFCFSQRLSFPCGTQKRESVVTVLN